MSHSGKNPWEYFMQILLYLCERTVTYPCNLMPPGPLCNLRFYYIDLFLIVAAYVPCMCAVGWCIEVRERHGLSWCWIYCSKMSHKPFFTDKAGRYSERQADWHVVCCGARDLGRILHFALLLLPHANVFYTDLGLATDALAVRSSSPVLWDIHWFYCPEGPLQEPISWPHRRGVLPDHCTCHGPYCGTGYFSAGPLSFLFAWDACMP